MPDDELNPLQAAAAYEEEIAEEAQKIRDEVEEGKGDKTYEESVREAFRRLRPLLRRPIPEGYIERSPAVKGKPYDSTGIKSGQVVIDRLDNVLTPLWWREEVNWDEGGKLCHVTLEIGPAEAPLLRRSAMGGVDRGSTLGNVYKGSYTNALKPCGAKLGIGAEVYRGAVDFDPDVNSDVAKQAEASAGNDIAKKIVDLAWTVTGAKGQLQLAASHVAGRDVGDCSTKKKAIDVLSTLTLEEATKVDNWVRQKKEEGSK